MALKIHQILGLANSLISRKESFNFESVTLADGDLFEHSLGSMKLSVEFYESGSRKAIHADWEPVDLLNIRYYGPAFTGDVFITKR
ncbi:MAG: hypothetical protein NXI00_11025 [Cytophagales bacterium]|nr:hypothetical protein [Cytophagales bacterium]